MSAFSKFYFKPTKGEWIQTTVSPDSDSDSGIYGTVEEKGKAVKDALVLLFRAEGEITGGFISAVITGSEGEFAFGPLIPGQLYVIKVFKDQLKLRELEISL